MTITIKPLEVVLVPEVKRTLQALSYTTIDDTDTKTLTIKFRPLFTGAQIGPTGQPVPNLLPSIVVSGPAYDALGQWTDEDVRKLVCEKLGATPAS